jgi:chromosome partitioning protein
MKIITVTNRKGGVLKSTLVFIMAVYFSSMKKKKVLVLDGDPAANVSLTFKLRAGSENSDTRLLPKLSEFLEQEIETADSDHGISVMPGDLRLAQLEKIEPDLVIAAVSAIRDIDGYDICIIDSAPTASNFVVAAKALSDFVVIPHTFDDYSDGGLTEVTQQLSNLRSKGISSAELLAIVPTRIDGSDKPQCAEVAAALSGNLAGYITPPINSRRTGRQAMGEGLAPWEINTQSAVKKEVLSVMAFLASRLFPIDLRNEVK